jgi:hypothetical protein
MSEKKTSEAQIRATRNWEARNIEKTRHDRGLRAARSFIRNRATIQDLDELVKLIADRQKELK